MSRSASGARVAAVDLGATSVRVAVVDLAAPAPAVEVVHRWGHGPVAGPGGTLRWDWERITAEVERGLDRALVAGPLASIGVDGWGVDYGLLDGAGRLVAPPCSYRDGRTAGWRATAEAIGLERLYEVSGIQLMGINTLFQLAAHDRAELERAVRLLLLPDLLVHRLTGWVGAERSNASTTGLLDARTGDWSGELAEAVGVRRGLLCDVVAAGERAGAWRGVPVHVVGSHDTASAFLGAPGGGTAGTVVAATGTWVVVGAERAAPDTSPAALAANFSNEAGAFGGVRFLKNVTGLWLLERCRAAWGEPPVERLVAEAAAAAPAGGEAVFDASDERFTAPAGDVEAEVRAAAGLGAGAPRGAVVRAVLASIADGVARVAGELGAVTGVPARRVALVGGGARIGLLRELLARRSGLEVAAGSPEATALGNAVAQGIGLGYFPDLAAARRWLSAGAGAAGTSPPGAPRT